MKYTPLYESHLRLGAKMMEFGGWMMPLHYTNVIDEHTTTRTKAGLFDICHMGEILVAGPGAGKFLQHAITNDISRLSSGKCMYSALCNESGGTIDDLILYMFSADRYMAVVNAGTIDKDMRHFETLLEGVGKGMDVTIIDESDKTSKLDLQGHLAEKILQQSTDALLSSLARFRFVIAKVYGRDVLISRSGYTGEDGFELYFDSSFCIEIWNSLLENGGKYDLKPIGLVARDTLRIEASYSLYGHELNDDITPVEAGIGFVVKDKAEEYPGKKILLEQKTLGTGRNFVCFEMLDRGIPRERYDLYSSEREKIGYVTSGTFSPMKRKGIGMGLIGSPLPPGSNIFVSIRGTLSPAIIVNRPFYQHRG